MAGARCRRRPTPRWSAEIDAALRDIEQRQGIAARIAAGQVQMLGSSGTVTTLAAVHLKLPPLQPPPRRWRGAALRRSAPRLAPPRRTDHDERASNPCIGAERADLVLAGCAILEAICRLWPVGRLRVADRGIREGILLEPRPGLQADMAAARKPQSRRAARHGRARQDRQAALGLLGRLARAPAQRSLCRRGASASAIARARPSS